MKIYTVAKKYHETYGHGSFGYELQIRCGGLYGAGSFPPCFKSKEDAQKHLNTMDNIDEREVVELELKD
jgi:hypothetical protein